MLETKSALPPSVDRLSSRLSSLRRSDGLGASNAMALLEVVRTFGRASFLCDVVDAIRSSAQLLATCAKLSLTHPLGFDKFVLLATADYQLRVHLWPPRGGDELREDIHNHRFSLASFVLAGALCMETYQESPTGVPLRRYAESRDRINRDYLFRDDGFMQVERMQSLIFTTGSSYYMGPDILHRIITPSDELTATMFIKIPEERRETTVLLPSGRQRGCQHRSPQVEPEIMSAKLARLVADIKRSR